MQRFLLGFFSLLLAFGVTSNTFALDSFYIASENYYGQKYIKIFSASGTLTSSIPIGNNFSKAYFLAGKWNSSENAIVAINAKAKGTNAFLINNDGTVGRSQALGQNVVQILAVDYNNNGLSDLVVQYRNNPVKIFLDFGDLTKNIKNTSYNALAKADIITVQTSAGQKLGNLKLNPYNRNFPNSFDQAKNAATSYNSGNYIQAPNEKGKKKKVKLNTDVHSISPVLLNGKSGFITQSAATKLKLVGNGLKRVIYSKGAKATFFSGFYTSDTNSSLVIGNPLNANTGTAKIKLIDPLKKSSQEITLNINQPNYGILRATKKASEKTCNWAKALVEALNRGDIDEATRLYNLIIKSGEDVSTCERNDDNNYNDDNNDDDNDNDNDNDDPYNEPTFTANSIQYLTSVIRLESNTGMGATPCAYIKNARDGNLGFLAKNSDTHPGTVYLVPGYYTNGRVLNAISFKTMYKTTYTGIANGGRSHFRLYSKRLPFGPHIFAADKNGITICWKVPGGLSRVE